MALAAVLLAAGQLTGQGPDGNSWSASAATGPGPPVVAAGTYQRYNANASPGQQRHIIVGPPALTSRQGELIDVKPSVDVRAGAYSPDYFDTGQTQPIGLTAGSFGDGPPAPGDDPLNALPPPNSDLRLQPEVMLAPDRPIWSEEPLLPDVPIFDQLVDSACRHGWPWISWAGHHDPCRGWGNPQPGIGQERVMYAPLILDITQPMNNYRFRLESAHDWEFPDRAEYLWAAIGRRGPREAETEVDYFDVRMMTEIGGGAFSVQTEIPIRFINPEENANHGGLGDMTVATKLRLMDGQRWQITQYMKTYINTGAPSSGLGTGHISMDQGVLYRFKWNEITYLHGQVKYWFPIAGDVQYSGQVFEHGIGVSRVLQETDRRAWIGTLEMSNWMVQNGLKTLAPPATGTEPVDGEFITNFYPGIRRVWDCGGDMGLVELGLVGGFSITGPRWYRSMLGLELRWSY